MADSNYDPARIVASGAAPSPADPPASGRAGRLLTLLAALAVVTALPYLVGQVVYQIRLNQLQAGVDVATKTLTGLKPQLSDFELASRMVAKRLDPSVVSIVLPGDFGRDGQGSGVIVDAAGYIVTNYHVVSQATTIEVQLSDGRRTSAAVVGADDLLDLAVLKIDLPNLIAAEWGDSEELEVGDMVWAVGSPYGLDRSYSFGIVSAKSRRSESGLTRDAYQEYLQTDAAVNPGNSGGPLLNIAGQIIGINTAIIGVKYQGISFAIPSSVAKQEYDQLRAKGTIERAWLGIEPDEVPNDVQKRLGLSIGEGVYVHSVRRNTPAERAGIQRGDVILKWNDFVAADPTLLSRAIAATKIGSVAKVRLVRGEIHEGAAAAKRTEFDLNVTVERRAWSVPESPREPEQPQE
ncbi:MAG TPA: trypsin-like peptidase domain-containing protein [Lacipirellulaceae bacterium]|jgi:S1-C subfamily serine protease